MPIRMRLIYTEEKREQAMQTSAATTSDAVVGNYFSFDARNSDYRLLFGKCIQRVARAKSCSPA